MDGRSLKVLGLSGSPRKNGNTARVLGWVEDELRARGHATERLAVADYALQGCVGCYLCQNHPGELFCSRKDRGLELLGKIVEADLVIYSTGLYWWDFTAQLKLLIDRHFCLVHGSNDPATHASLIENKPLALLVTACDHAGEGNSDLISEMFKRIAAYCKARVAGELVIPFCRTPHDLGEIQREQAREFAGKLIAQTV